VNKSSKIYKCRNCGEQFEEKDLEGKADICCEECGKVFEEDLIPKPSVGSKLFCPEFDYLETVATYTCPKCSSPTVQVLS
jgi:DNA-directed RNA polymerase subunit RPC12/RpoP